MSKALAVFHGRFGRATVYQLNRPFNVHAHREGHLIFHVGGMPAQMLAQTRPGARGALLFHTAVPLSEFGGSWPEGAPLQIHFMEDDPWAEEDLPAAREIVETIEEAELFLYPGDRHLFADNSVSDYDEEAAALLKQRALSFLAGVR